MRDVDHETGVAAGRSLGDLPSVDDDDLVAWVQLSKAPRCREAGKASPDDQPVGHHLAVQRAHREATRRDRFPTGGAGVDGQALDDVVAHRTAPPATSNPLVLSSVFRS
ncbi:hypothetical protein D9M69_533560 [compost metagenome]